MKNKKFDIFMNLSEKSYNNFRLYVFLNCFVVIAIMIAFLLQFMIGAATWFLIIYACIGLLIYDCCAAEPKDKTIWIAVWPTVLCWWFWKNT